MHWYLCENNSKYAFKREIYFQSALCFVLWSVRLETNRGQPHIYRKNGVPIGRGCYFDRIACEDHNSVGVD